MADGFVTLRGRPDVLVVIVTFVLALIMAIGFLSVGVIALVGRRGTGSGLGVLEQAMRAALAAAGARLLEAVLAGDDDGYAGPHVEGGIACGVRQLRHSL